MVAPRADTHSPVSDLDNLVLPNSTERNGPRSVDSASRAFSSRTRDVIAKPSQVRTGEDLRILMARVSIWLHWLAAGLAFILMAIPPSSAQLAIRITPLALGAIVFTIPLR